MNAAAILTEIENDPGAVLAGEPSSAASAKSKSDDDDDNDDGDEDYNDRKDSKSQRNVGMKRKRSNSASPPPPPRRSNRISSTELRRARGEDGGIGREASESAAEKEPEPVLGPHPEESWMHAPLPREVRQRMDKKGEIEAIKAETLRFANKVSEDLTTGRVNSKGEYCYLCDPIHTVDDKTGRNRFIDELKAILDEFASKPLHYVVTRAQEYYNMELLHATGKKMTKLMWMQHMLVHNPTQVNISKHQVETLQRVCLRVSSQMFPENDSQKIDNKTARLLTHLYAEVRKAKHWCDHKGTA